MTDILTKEQLAQKQRTYRAIIGIDPGVHTGLAVWIPGKKQFFFVGTLQIHAAMSAVKFHNEDSRRSLLVIVEDARQATYGRKLDFHKAQGTGSVKRDCGIWDDFLKAHMIDYQMRRPQKAITKLADDIFRRTTSWDAKTDSHAKDAAMLVFGM